MIYSDPAQTLALLRTQLIRIVSARADVPARDVEATVDVAMDAFVAAEAAFAGIILRAPSSAAARAATELAGRLLEAEIHQMFQGPLARALTTTAAFRSTASADHPVRLENKDG